MTVDISLFEWRKRGPRWFLRPIGSTFQILHMETEGAGWRWWIDYKEGPLGEPFRGTEDEAKVAAIEAAKAVDAFTLRREWAPPLVLPKPPPAPPPLVWSVVYTEAPAVEHVVMDPVDIARRLACLEHQVNETRNMLLTWARIPREQLTEPQGWSRTRQLEDLVAELELLIVQRTEYRLAALQWCQPSEERDVDEVCDEDEWAACLDASRPCNPTGRALLSAAGLQSPACAFIAWVYDDCVSPLWPPA